MTSTGAGAGSAAGAHTTRVIAAASRQGYAVEVVDGRLTVDKAALVVRAADASRRYGAADPGFTAAYSGFVLGDGADDLGGTLGFTTPAGRASAVGRYGLTPRGLTSGNYAISYAPGTLTIERAPLLVTPAFAARSYGADTPAFAARYAGFVLGDGAGDLNGRVAFATDAGRPSPVGLYRVTASGLASDNYDIRYLPGALEVRPAPLTVTALDAIRPFGARDPAFGVRIEGFVLGQDAGDLGGALGFATPTSRLSPVGQYGIVPGGLASRNYAITYRPGTLTIAPARFGAARFAGSDVRRGGFARGTPPFTPGDASFRTTTADGPPALGNPFGLAYSLGRFTELAPAQAAGTQGFVPAAGDTQGFVPAAGGIQADRRDAGCGGSVSLGADGCGRQTVVENYWQAGR